MDSTNCGENCAFVKSGFCKSDCECPFYIESWWQCKGEKTPKLVKDCQPKRASLQLNNADNRIFDLQAEMVILRNKFDNIENLLLQLISNSNDYINSQRDLSQSISKNIEAKNESTNINVNPVPNDKLLI